MKSKKLTTLLIALIVVICGGFRAVGQDSQQEALKAYEQARKLVNKKDWNQAVESLKAYIDAYTNSPYLEESLYWLGYSLNRMGRELAGTEGQLNANQRAVEYLNRLIENYARSPWNDDARVLRIQIAEELVKRGMTDYRKYINGSLAGLKSLESLKSLAELQELEAMQSMEAMESLSALESLESLSGLEGMEGALEVLDQTLESMEGEEKEIDPELEIKLVALDSLMAMNEDKVYPILVKLVREEENVRLRERALHILARSNRAEAAALMIELATKDPDTSIREQAIFWLGQNRSGDSLEALMKIYGEAKDKKIKEMVLHALGQSPSERAFETLVKIAKSDEDPEAREQAVFTLAHGAHSKKAMPVILEIFDTTQDKEIKEQLIYVIARSNDEKARARLVQIARSGSDRGIRKQAIFWLGQRAAEGENMDILLGLLDTEKDPGIRENLIQAVARSKDPRAKAKLLEIARSGESKEAREMALFWLGHEGLDEQNLKAFIDIYDSADDIALKEKLIYAFSRSKNPGAKEKLRIIIRTDPDIKAREQAALFLAQTKDEANLDLFLDLYKSSEDKRIKELSMFALGRIKSKKAVLAMIEMARNEKDPEMKKQLIFWLGRTKDEDAVKFLKELLEK